MEGFCSYSIDDVPDREHVKDDREDSDNFLVLFWLIEFVNIQLGCGETPPDIGWILHVIRVQRGGRQAVHHHLRASLGWVPRSEESNFISGASHSNLGLDKTNLLAFFRR